MKLWQWTVIIVGLVIVLIVVPLGIHGATSEFGGADGAAEEAITEVNPDYKPWFTSIWEPPGGETESLLFALQAAAGSALIFYGFGFIVGRRKGRSESAQALGGSVGASIASGGDSAQAVNGSAAVAVERAPST